MTNEAYLIIAVLVVCILGAFALWRGADVAITFSWAKGFGLETKRSKTDAAPPLAAEKDSISVAENTRIEGNIGRVVGDEGGSGARASNIEVAKGATVAPSAKVGELVGRKTPPDR